MENGKMNLIISSQELRKIKEAIGRGEKEIETSLDLGLTKTILKLEKIKFSIGKIKDDEKDAYLLVGKKLKKVQFFSPETNLAYTLIPTSGRPILQVSGTPMHKQAFVERIQTERLTGRVLDSGTGLGYTAIEAAKTADLVMSIEIDENVMRMARLNPFSQELFQEKIILISGDLTLEITKFKNEEFDYLIFDGGTPKSSGEFFSIDNYREAFRVLKRRGRLYHYLPKHHITRGRDFIGEMIKKMISAGFILVERNDEGSYAVMKK